MKASIRDLWPRWLAAAHSLAAAHGIPPEAAAQEVRQLQDKMREVLAPLGSAQWSAELLAEVWECMVGR